MKTNRFPDTNQIKHIRHTLGLTQMALAKRSGVSQSTIAKIERGRIKGSYPEVVKLLEALERESDIRTAKVQLKDICTKRVISVQVGDALRRASELMRDHDISQMPVFDGDRPVGSISERRILNLVLSGVKAEETNHRPVGSVMDDPLPIVNEDVEKDAVEALVRSEHAILIAKGGKITGIVTSADLMQIDWVI